jgi:hypothetical protein
MEVIGQHRDKNRFLSPRHLTTPCTPYGYIIIFVVFRPVGIYSDSGFTSPFPALALPLGASMPCLFSCCHRGGSPDHGGELQYNQLLSCVFS